MKIVILATFVLAVFANFAQSETYKCNIESYGRPVGFSGGYLAQKDIMKSWMPYKTFYVVTDGDTAIMRHSGNLEIPSLRNHSTESHVAFTFRDFPLDSGGDSRSRNTRFSYSPVDRNFTIKLTMNPGHRYRKSGGAAFGSCVAS